MLRWESRCKPKKMPLNLIESILVPHDGFAEALNQMQQIYEVSGAVTESVGKPLLAPSRAGKSRVIEEFKKSHPSKRTADGLIVPVLSVKVPSKPTVKGLVEVLLAKLEDPNAYTGTENQKTARLKTLLSETSTQVMVLDEFQHFVDKSSMKVQHQLADWLKVLLDESGVAIVVVGLESATAVLDQNEQLEGRFLTPARLSRFDWSNKDQRSEFLAVLDAFESVLRGYVDLPEIANTNMGFRLYVATGGLIGYLTLFLKMLVWNAVFSNASKLTLQDFSKAYIESIAKDKEGLSSAGSPFKKSFATEPNAANLAAAMEVGVPRVVETLRPRKSRAKKRTSASAALSAS